MKTPIPDCGIFQIKNEKLDHRVDKTSGMIKQSIYLLLSFFSIAQIQAQAPTYDECNTAIQLGEAPFGTCTTTEYTNIDATLTDNLFSDPLDNIPSCWSSVDHDVWFSFTTPSDGSYIDFEIFVTSTGSNPIGQFKAALYRGECLVDELAELDCEVAAPGETEIKFDASGLTPGLTYFIRVDDQSPTATPNWGTFNVCVDTLPDINLMCVDLNSTESSGILYDSGGPDNEYANGENCSFTICPTAPNTCIALTVNTYEIEYNFDELTIHDGDSTSDPVIGNILDGGGSCYTVYASSGCVTVDWFSDNFVTDGGFEITWESFADDCPTYTPPITNTAPTEAMIIEKLGSISSAISNVTVNCSDNAHATFEGGDNTNLFMDQGVVLTTGSVDYAFSPNNFDGDITTNNNNNGDPDLEQLADDFQGLPPTLIDACILEMDVLAAGDEISLEYIFGSDDYVGNLNPNNGIRDVFGIWISGPGIVGDPNFNDQELISVIPGTATPVHYETVNPVLNYQYYRSNEENELGPRYDGLTTDFNSIEKKTLTASAQVEQCSTYHVKIGVADLTFFGNDPADSGVFFGEINNGLPAASLVAVTSFDDFVEGCTDTDVLNLNLSNPLAEDLTLEVQVGGTATSGLDYTLTIPNTITFQEEEP